MSEARTYRMRKRLDDVEQTRRRIVEAAVDLHGSVGPVNTTFAAVADLAGVQRSTVYRHFPDEEALFGACTSHWLADHPWPEPDTWTTETHPPSRLGRALSELYGYYAANEAMLANSFRDIEVMSPFVSEFMRARIRGIHETLVDAWPAEARGRELGAAVAHAIDFRSWQSLAATDLTTDEAAQLMATMVTCAVAAAGDGAAFGA